MNPPQTIGVSLGGAATPFWFPLAGQHATIASEHTLFPVEAVADREFLILSPELAWTSPAFSGGTFEIPEPVTGHTGSTLFDPLTVALPDRYPDAPHATVSEAAREFAARAELEGLLDEALALLHRCFRVVDAPKVEFEIDPEVGDPYLLLDVRVGGSVLENVAAHKRFAREWSRKADWPQVKMIRLAFDLD